MEIVQEKNAALSQGYSDQWLLQKPKFYTHQRVMAAPGLFGRISGMQQILGAGPQETQWRYQVSSPTEHGGVNLSWWDEEHLQETSDLFLISVVENGERVKTRGRGTLEEAIADVRYFTETAHRLFHEQGRKIAVQITCCNIPELDGDQVSLTPVNDT
jgi:hypothetical protein